LKKKEKYQYLIVKTYNKKRKKNLYISRDYEKCKERFKILMKKSEKVTIPKSSINRSGITEITTELLLITNNPALNKLSYNDKSTTSNKNKWLVIESRKYREEDKFYCYPDRNMVTYVDILHFLQDKPAFYAIYIFFNKIIIDSSLKVEKAIVFKTQADAISIYNKLIKEGLKTMFLGSLNKNSRKKFKNKIMDGVGIAYINLYNKKSAY